MGLKATECLRLKIRSSTVKKRLSLRARTDYRQWSMEKLMAGNSRCIFMNLKITKLSMTRATTNKCTTVKTTI